eukprot:1151831-Pelagomonas_calceolata.AAC.1
MCASPQRVVGAKDGAPSCGQGKLAVCALGAACQGERRVAAACVPRLFLHQCALLLQKSAKQPKRGCLSYFYGSVPSSLPESAKQQQCACLSRSASARSMICRLLAIKDMIMYSRANDRQFLAACTRTCAWVDSSGAWLP